jgi:hypothetical protein
MRQNCPSITDKGTQTLTFDVQFPHERCCQFGELPQFCLFKIAHRQVRLAQVDGETPVCDSGDTFLLGPRTLFSAEF